MKLNWGHGIVIFFGIFISLAIVFIIFSLKQNNDLVERDYYKKGAEFTRQMIINQRSEVFKDSVRVNVAEDLVILTLANTISSGADSLILFFFRPSDEKLDNIYNNFHANDTIKILLSDLVRGRYVVQLSWKMDGDDYMLKKDIFVP